MEALSEYAKSLPIEEPLDVKVQFTSLRRNKKENLALNKKGEKVETDLQVNRLVLCGLLGNSFTRNSTSQECGQMWLF